MKSFNIGVIGIGHIGLATALTLLSHGHRVYCLDWNTDKIKLLKDAIPPYYEPGIKDELKKGLIEGRLFFTHQYSAEFLKLDVILLTVDTPSDMNGHADLSALNKCVNSLNDLYQNNNFTHRPVIVIKSTVPPGTTKALQKKFNHFRFAFIPEFLREGCALQDSLVPERLVIGSDDMHLSEFLCEVFAAYSDQTIRLKMSTHSAEITKYATNAFLAARISLINEFTVICDRMNGNIEDVAAAISVDSRIGSQFLKSGIGYGGSCFPKDLKALKSFENQIHFPLQQITAIEEMNKALPDLFIEKIKQKLGSLHSKKITVWGLAFKPQTSDVRSSQSLVIIKKLLREGVQLQLHDPQALESAKKYFLENNFDSQKITFFEDKEKALDQTHALLILTDWVEYMKFNWKESIVYNNRIPLFDGRLCVRPEDRIQLNYSALGWN